MNSNRRTFLSALSGSACAATALAAPSKPNVLFIVSDDHGYGDVSCYEHPKEIRTPNIDRIAQRGIRFTQGYASCYVCAPISSIRPPRCAAQPVDTAATRPCKFVPEKPPSTLCDPY